MLILSTQAATARSSLNDLHGCAAVPGSQYRRPVPRWIGARKAATVERKAATVERLAQPASLAGRWRPAHATVAGWAIRACQRQPRRAAPDGAAGRLEANAYAHG